MAFPAPRAASVTPTSHRTSDRTPALRGRRAWNCTRSPACRCSTAWTAARCSWSKHSPMTTSSTTLQPSSAARALGARVPSPELRADTGADTAVIRELAGHAEHPHHHHLHGRLPRPPRARHRRTQTPEPRRPPHSSQRLSARRGPRRGSQSADSAVAISVWGFAWAGVPTTRASTRLASKRTIRGAISRSMLIGSVPGRTIATTAIAR